MLRRLRSFIGSYVEERNKFRRSPRSSLKIGCLSPSTALSSRTSLGAGRPFVAGGGATQSRTRGQDSDSGSTVKALPFVRQVSPLRAMNPLRPVVGITHRRVPAPGHDRLAGATPEASVSLEGDPIRVGSDPNPYGSIGAIASHPSGTFAVAYERNGARPCRTKPTPCRGFAITNTPGFSPRSSASSGRTARRRSCASRRCGCLRSRPMRRAGCWPCCASRWKAGARVVFRRWDAAGRLTARGQVAGVNTCTLRGTAFRRGLVAFDGDTLMWIDREGRLVERVPAEGPPVTNGSRRLAVGWPAHDFTTLYARFGSRPLTLGALRLLVSAQPGHQIFSPSLALDAQGAALLAWETWPAESSGCSLWLRAFDPDGTPLGLQVCASRSGRRPRLAAVSPGRFWLAWERAGGRGHGLLGPASRGVACAVS